MKPPMACIVCDNAFAIRGTLTCKACTKVAEEKLKLNFRPGMPPISWGRPDSPPRPLCSICHGPLPEVPLIMWKTDCSSASFCDQCVEDWIVAEK
jgi:hypothetical protein